MTDPDPYLLTNGSGCVSGRSKNIMFYGCGFGTLLLGFVTQLKILSRGEGCAGYVMPKNREICGLAVASVADPGCLSPIPDSQIFSIPDPGFASKKQVVHPRSGSRIRILIFLPIPDPGSGVKKAPDPGSESAILAGPWPRSSRAAARTVQVCVNRVGWL